MEDPFAIVKGATMSYWTNQGGWILWSPGPDGKYDLTLENIASLYDGKPYDTAQVPPGLVDRTYDPTNGTQSAGDIWRIKQ